MAVNEVSIGASVIPSSMPVSCCGKRPLGMTTARKNVSATVATVAASVSAWWFNTQPRPRS